MISLLKPLALAVFFCLTASLSLFATPCSTPLLIVAGNHPTEVLSYLEAPSVNPPSTLLVQMQMYFNLKRKVRSFEAAAKDPSIIVVGVPPSNEEVTHLKSEILPKLVDFFRQDKSLSSASAEQLHQRALKALEWEITGEYSYHPRGGIEVERFRLLLELAGIDPHSPVRNWSEVFERLNLPFLTHNTVNKHLEEILSEGVLRRRPTPQHVTMSGDPNFVYLEIGAQKYTRNIPSFTQRGNRSRVFDAAVNPNASLILFPPSILDSVDWSHMNGFWQYGEKHPNFSFYNELLTVAFLKYVSSTQKEEFQSDLKPEVLFSDIDLRKIEFRVLVDSNYATELKSKLQNLKVPPIFVNRIE